MKAAPAARAREDDGYQRLAVAVLQRAVLDADAPDPRRQAGARGFLSRPSPELRHWCAVAGLDDDDVRAMAGQRFST